MNKYFERPDVIDIPRPLLLRIALGTALLIALFRSTPMYVMGGEPFGFAIRQFSFTLVFTLLLWGMNILLFDLMVRYASRHARWLRPAASLLLSLLLGCVLVLLVMERFRPPMPLPVGGRPFPPPRGFRIMPILQVISVNLLILLVMEVLMMKHARDRVARENDALKMAGLEARINSLKAQLQPHFLFNALTALKALNRQSPGQADVYIDELAALLRSSMQEREALIPLNEEMELCRKYIALQKLRFGDAFMVEMAGQVDHPGHWLIPMYSLQQLAENAIKHNAFSVGSPLRLRIVLDPDNGSVTTLNNLQRRSDAEPGEGIGLRNLDERCMLLGLGPIQRHVNEDDFSVTIKLRRA